MSARGYRRAVQRRIDGIAVAAAKRMWEARDRITVRLLPNGPDERIRWDRYVVSFDDVQYLPVDEVSLERMRVTSLLLSEDGALVLNSDTPIVADTWNAALAWRMLRRMTGATPVLREAVPVPRAPHPHRPEGVLSRIRRIFQPYMTLTDPLDIVVNELCMNVLRQVTETRPVRTDGGLAAPLKGGLLLSQHGRRYGSFHIVDPQEGAVPVPRRLYRVFDQILNRPREVVPA